MDGNEQDIILPRNEHEEDASSVISSDEDRLVMDMEDSLIHEIDNPHDDSNVILPEGGQLLEYTQSPTGTEGVRNKLSEEPIREQVEDIVAEERSQIELNGSSSVTCTGQGLDPVVYEDQAQTAEDSQNDEQSESTDNEANHIKPNELNEGISQESDPMPSNQNEEPVSGSASQDAIMTSDWTNEENGRSSKLSEDVGEQQEEDRLKKNLKEPEEVCEARISDTVKCLDASLLFHENDLPEDDVHHTEQHITEVEQHEQLIETSLGNVGHSEQETAEGELVIELLPTSPDELRLVEQNFTDEERQASGPGAFPNHQNTTDEQSTAEEDEDKLKEIADISTHVEESTVAVEEQGQPESLLEDFNTTSGNQQPEQVQLSQEDIGSFSADVAGDKQDSGGGMEIGNASRTEDSGHAQTELRQEDEVSRGFHGSATSEQHRGARVETDLETVSVSGVHSRGGNDQEGGPPTDAALPSVSGQCSDVAWGIQREQPADPIVIVPETSDEDCLIVEGPGKRPSSAHSSSRTSARPAPSPVVASADIPTLPRVLEIVPEEPFPDSIPRPPNNSANLTGPWNVVPDVPPGAATDGHVTWKSIDGITVPCLTRNSTKYVSVKMVESKLLSKFPRIDDMKDMVPIYSYYVTESEASLLSKINERCFQLSFGSKPFTEKDLIVSLDDFLKFYDEAKLYFKNKNIAVPPTPTDATEQSVSPSGKLEGGWVQINNTVVPYVIRAGSKLVPLSVIKYGAGLTLDSRLKKSSWPCLELEFLFLNCECRSSGINFTFSRKTKLVKLELVIRTSGSKVKIQELPKGSPLQNGRYVNVDEDGASAKMTEHLSLPQPQVTLPLPQLTPPHMFMPPNVTTGQLPGNGAMFIPPGIPQPPPQLPPQMDLRMPAPPPLGARIFPPYNTSMSVNNFLGPPNPAAVANSRMLYMPPVPEPRPPALPPPPKVVIKPVSYEGVPVPCLIRAKGEAFALLEILNKLFIANLSFVDFQFIVRDRLGITLHKLSADEEKEFIRYYRLPTQSITFPYVISFREFQQHYPRIKQIMRMHEARQNGTPRLGSGGLSLALQQARRTSPSIAAMQGASRPGSSHEPPLKRTSDNPEGTKKPKLKRLEDTVAKLKMKQEQGSGS